MSRVLIIRFSSIGDVILTFPSLGHIASEGHEIHVLTKQAYLGLFETQKQVRKVHTISDHASAAELLAKARELKALDFDVVYDLHRNLRSRIVSLVLGRPTRRISKYRFRELFLFVFRRKIFGWVFGAPIDRAREALRVVGGSAVGLVGGAGSARLPDLSAGLLPAADPGAGWVCVAMESAWAEKQWPEERFVEMARTLAQRGYRILWLGVRSLPQAARNVAGSVDLTGKLSLPQAGAVLAKTRLLVCNDTGLMHLAETVGTPVVAIFGPTSREVGFAPRLEHSRVVEADLWCRPCSKTGRWCIRPVARRKCLSDVTVAQVAEAAREALAGETWNEKERRPT